MGIDHVAFRYMGGKFNLAPRIIELMPPHECFCEPMAGAANVLLRKPPSQVEVLNDIDGNIINFFEQLRNNTQALMWKLTWTPYSRRLHDDWEKEWKEKGPPQDPIERAVRWHYLVGASIDGILGNDFSYSEHKNKAEERNAMVDNLFKVAHRLRHVVLECKDFSDIIQRYDGPETLFYLDPPYQGLEKISDTRTYYAAGFSLERHKELAELVHNIRGKVILSYYPSPKIDEWYKDFYRVEIDVVKSSAGVEEGYVKPKGIELLLMNYPGRPLFRWAKEQQGLDIPYY